MKTITTFLIVLIPFTNCLNYSADHINCVLFGTSADDRIKVKTSEPEKILEQKLFNPLLKTVFIIPGVPATIDYPHAKAFIQSFINAKRYNVLYFEGDYYLNDAIVPGVCDEVMLWFGKLYGSVISKLISFGLSVDSIELVGHSWGAGVAYLAASNTIPKLPLLIGLDPVNVYDFRKGSADYTIALHTNIGQIGKLQYNSSDTDLIVNGGITQPNCTDRQLQEIESATELYPIATCSHILALYYWGSIIENPKLFYGVECNEIECNYTNIEQLGPNLRTPGIFYFKTSEASPYGLSLNGIKNIIPIDQKTLKGLHFWTPVWQLVLYYEYGQCSPQRQRKLINLMKSS